MSNPKEAHKDDELHKILSNGYVSCDDRGFPGQKHRSRRPRMFPKFSEKYTL